MTVRHTPMGCEQFAEALGAYLERDVDESTRAAMDAHALACDDCGALVADIRKLRVDAANLPELAPSRDLWEGIAARIDAPVISISDGRSGNPHRAAAAPTSGRRWGGRGLVAAASLLAAAGLGGLVTYAVVPRAAAPAPQQIASTVSIGDTSASVKPTPVQESPAQHVATTTPAAEPRAVTIASVASEAPAPGTLDEMQLKAQATFDLEITRLRAIVRRRSTQLDPVTLSVIERNLKVIDEAIAQCKAALAKDPSSRFLIESLNGALANKVELLRTAAMLPART